MVTSGILHSIRTKFILGTLAAIAGSGAISYATFSRAAESQSLDNLRANAIGLAEGTALVIAPLIAFESSNEMNKVLDALTKNPDFAYAVIADQDHKPVVSKNGTALPGHELVSSTRTFVERGLMHVMTPAVDSGQHWGYFHLGLSLDRMNQGLSETRATSLATILSLSLLALGGLGWMLEFMVCAPLGRLTKSTLELAAGRYPENLPTKSNDEMGVLTSGFNDMSSELKDAETVREQLIQDLRESQAQAEAASKLKGEFLANMSHEIRTPMNVIMGMTELTLDTELHSKQRRYLDMVKNSANSLLAIINDILDFSKVEAGKLDLEPIEFSLVETVAEVTRTLRARASQKGLDLSCRIQPSVPEFLVADPSRLRQILVNLVGNAIKFTERGEVRIQVKLNSESESEMELHFTVSDTGIGIPKEQQQFIFESFAQADGSTTRHFGGTGLGLAISSQLIGLMGGRIWVESAVGEGSTFHFVIRAGRADPRVEVSAPEALEGVRVMVIDHDADTRNQLSMMLDSWQMESALVDNRDAALQVMKWSSKLGRHFEMLLVRDQLIKGGADAFAQEIRKNPDFAEIPIILIAAEELDEEQLQEMGASGCLTTPISQSKLLELVLKTLLASPDEERQAPRVSDKDTPNAVAEEAGSGEEDSKRSLKVLLAEDIPENQALAVALLERQGHSVSVASNGREVLARLERGAVDLILMDIQMPEMGGVEATAAIRERERTTGDHTPIIAMTAHAMKGDREKYLRAGMDGYVSKPIRRQELFDAIEQLTSKTVLT